MVNTTEENDKLLICFFRKYLAAYSEIKHHLEERKTSLNQPVKVTDTTNPGIRELLFRQSYDLAGHHLQRISVQEATGKGRQLFLSSCTAMMRNIPLDS